MSSIELVIPARNKQLGEDFPIRRLLPYMKRRMVGPFIFWDHMGPVELKEDKQLVVLPHPHIGLATITWLFSGKILHRDSLGNEQQIRPGEVNWMTAGKGIVHSERSLEHGVLEGIQLWLALPKEKESIEPSFYHCKSDNLPKIKTKDSEITVIAGKFENASSPVPVYSDLFYTSVVLNEQSTLKHKLKHDHQAAIYVIDGAVEIEGVEYNKYDMIVFNNEFCIQTKLSTAKFMLFGGQSFEEKRHIWWNFVSTNKEDIEKAKDDLKNNKFPKVINEVGLTPLPKD